MGYNIGPKIGIEGEKEFQRQIKAINNEYKTLQAQTKALTAEFDKNGDQQGKLKMQTQQLEKQIDAQKRAIEEMEKALDTAAKTTDANSDAVTTWEGKLYNARATVAQLEKELQDTEDALRRMEDGVEDAGDAADSAGGQVAEFGDILKGNLVADAIWDGLREGAQLMVEIGKSAVAASSELCAESAQFEQTFGEMEKAATTALQKLEKQTGISATRIKGNFSTVYAFAKTMGSDNAEAMDIASRAMAAAADSAAYYDKTVEEVTETIQAYIKGNYANDAALGIASTETTRNAAAMERYGKAFKELTEAQKVDTLLAMVEAGNKASGAMGQAAREAGEWTNVTGELEDAQKQLLAVIGEPILEETIPIVQKLTEAMRELAEVTPGEQLAKDMESFVSTMEEAERTYDATMATTMATATVAEQYIMTLEGLEAQGLNTAEAHAQYESVVAQLKAVMPELNVTINEQTGLIEQNTDALLAEVEAWKKLAIQQAIQDKMRGQLEAYGKAKLTVAEATEKLNQVTGEYSVIEQQLYDVIGVKGVAAIREITEQGSTYYYLLDKSGKLLKTITGKSPGTGKTATGKLAEEAVKLYNQMTELHAEIVEANGIILDYETEMDRLTKLMSDNTDTQQENTDAHQKQKVAISQTMAALVELENAYQETKNATRAMLDSSISLWEGVATKSDWTAKKVLENWRSQMKAFDQYTANLKKAKEMGLADGIIDALSDGSQQSMQILNAIVNQSKYSVGEINAAFTDLDIAKDGTTDMLLSMDETLQEGYDALVEDAITAGKELMDGIAQGIKDNGHTVLDALADTIGFRVQSSESEAAGLLGAFQGLLPSNWKSTESGNASNGAKVEQNFYVTQQPGESGGDFAKRVAEMIAIEAEWRGAGLGG